MGKGPESGGSRGMALWLSTGGRRGADPGTPGRASRAALPEDSPGSVFNRPMSLYVRRNRSSQALATLGCFMTYSECYLFATSLSYRTSGTSLDLLVLRVSFLIFHLVSSASLRLASVSFLTKTIVFPLSSLRRTDGAGEDSSWPEPCSSYSSAVVMKQMSCWYIP